MPLEEPSWWYGEGRSTAAELLSPIAHVYGAVVERRFRKAEPYRASLPVICIGNFTAGGTGKTPLTRFLVETLALRKIDAVCLSRGYGGSLPGPIWVDAEHHLAQQVGDEPLLLARAQPDVDRVMVARDRKAGIRAIENGGGTDAVIMDDGLQNPSVAKDLSIAIVDARRGFGNGRVIPAGPLRARLSFQLGLVDCIVVMGGDAGDPEPPVFEDLKKRFHGPVLRGRVAPAGDLGWIAGTRLIAYAGIANPDRFFRMLAEFAPAALAKRPFGDHHVFTDEEAARLLAEADAMGAELVTTEKDLARLVGTQETCAELAKRSRALPIRVHFEERDFVRLGALIDGALKAGARN